MHCALPYRQLASCNGLEDCNKINNNNNNKTDECIYPIFKKSQSAVRLEALSLLPTGATQYASCLPIVYIKVSRTAFILL